MVTDFRLLGPLEVLLNGEQLDVGHRRQRLLLGVLLLEAGRPVRFDRLIDLAWSGEDPPRTARNALQVGVSKLRATLGEAAQIVTTGEAYRVDVAPDSVDVHRFRTLVNQARALKGKPAIDLYRQAIALWRGPVLAGTFGEEVRDLLCGGLMEERLRAVEERVDHELELGLHGRVIGELTDLLHDHPTRERPVGQLMVALYRSGRQADALEAFRKTRRRLVNELGIEPSRELEQLHRRILNSDPSLAAPGTAVSAPVLRRFLPRDVPDFTGRARDLRRLDEIALASSATSKTMVISAIAGVGGVGKTALAVHWAHAVAQRFPDGQLYLNLRGYDPRHPLRSDEATRVLLRALGVPGDEIPYGVDEAADLYRSTVADQKLLILLDNARSAEQVRPLLPASPGSLVLVTSRDSLAGLIARDGASRLVLDMMPPEEAVALLATILGADRVAAEPEAAQNLAKLCGCLPLALRVAAANLADLPATSLATYVRELGGNDRIAALAVDGDPESSVTAVFDRSYRALAAPVQELFRRLGLMPGADFTVDGVSAMLDLDPGTCTELLGHLAAVHLVNGLPGGRYAMHDFIHDYAAQLCERLDGSHERQNSIERLLDWYVAMSDQATGYFRRYQVPVLIDSSRRGSIRQLTDVGEALAWLDAEYSNLVAAIRLAASVFNHSHVVQLVHVLQSYFLKRGLIQDWIMLLELAKAAASTMIDVSAEGYTLLDFGWATEIAGDVENAMSHFREALRLFQTAGDTYGEAKSVLSLGGLNRKLGFLSEAFDQHGRALELFRELGDISRQVNMQSAISVDLYLLGRHEEGLSHAHLALEQAERIGAMADARGIRVNLGRMYAELDRHAEAIEHTEAALALYREAGGGAGEAMALTNLCYSLSRLGRHDEAIKLGLEAVEMANRLSFLEFETPALNALAEAHLLAGDRDAALRRHHEALEIAGRTGDAEEKARAEKGIALASGLA